MPIRVLCAPQAFKGTLSVVAVTRALATGVRRVPGSVPDECPLADGGDGSVDVLIGAGAVPESDEVDGPLPGMRVRAKRATLAGGRTVAIELAQASGLHLVPPEQRDVLRSSTRGTGQQLARALDSGFRRILLMVGGSATVDGGMGLLTALGYRFLDAHGEPLPQGGGALERLDRIDTTGAHPALRESEIVVGVDVTNPLVGPLGAAAVYGPQKGATPEQVVRLARGLARLATVIRQHFGRDVAELPGGGAAGGVAAGLAGIVGAQLMPGFSIVAEAIGLPERIERCDLVLTGEGQLDFQSAHGKTSHAVAALAQRAGKPCYAIVGRWAREVGANPVPFAGVVEAGSTSRLADEAAIASAAELALREWLSQRASELH